MGCGLCKSASADFTTASQPNNQVTERLFTVFEEGSELEESKAPKCPDALVQSSANTAVNRIETRETLGQLIPI